MNKILKFFLMVFFGTILMLQIIILYINNFETNGNNIVEKELKQYKSLHDIYNELNVLTEKHIINAEQIDNDWKIKIRIDGDKDYLVKEINKLESYKIANYTIYNNSNESYIVLEMICT